MNARLKGLELHLLSNDVKALHVKSNAFKYVKSLAPIAINKGKNSLNTAKEYLKTTAPYIKERYNVGMDTLFPSRLRTRLGTTLASHPDTRAAQAELTAVQSQNAAAQAAREANIQRLESRSERLYKRLPFLKRLGIQTVAKGTPLAAGSAITAGTGWVMPGGNIRNLVYNQIAEARSDKMRDLEAQAGIGIGQISGANQAFLAAQQSLNDIATNPEAFKDNFKPYIDRIAALPESERDNALKYIQGFVKDPTHPAYVYANQQLARPAFENVASSLEQRRISSLAQNEKAFYDLAAQKGFTPEQTWNWLNTRGVNFSNMYWPYADATPSAAPTPAPQTAPSDGSDLAARRARLPK
jgi:hypothetical protein